MKRVRISLKNGCELVRVRMSLFERVRIVSGANSHTSLKINKHVVSAQEIEESSKAMLSATTKANRQAAKAFRLYIMEQLDVQKANLKAGKPDTYICVQISTRLVVALEFELLNL